MEHKISFGTFQPEKRPTFLDFPLFPGVSFQWDEPTKRFPFTAEPKFSEILTKWKASVIVLVLESKALCCLFGYVQTNPDIFENAYFLHESAFFPPRVNPHTKNNVAYFSSIRIRILEK